MLDGRIVRGHGAVLFALFEVEVIPRRGWAWELVVCKVLIRLVVCEVLVRLVVRFRVMGLDNLVLVDYCSRHCLDILAVGGVADGI